MQRFKKILYVATSAADSDTAFARTIRLAGQNAARLTVVTVQRDTDRHIPFLKTESIRHQEEFLTGFVNEADTNGVKVQVKVLLGVPFVEIVKEVVSGNYDLVIKAAEGRGGLGRMLFGSTDWHLMRKCPCPVWIIKATKRMKIPRILAAVDPDPGVETNSELNKLILELATSLAVREGSQLHIVHAWSVPSEELIRSGRIRMLPEDVKRFVDETRAAHKEWLSGLLANHDLGGIAAKVHLLKGDPADVIPALARKSGAALVVMGTVARTGIPGFFIGNTAERALSNLSCSVLTVKPSSFETPVKLE